MGIFREGKRRDILLNYELTRQLKYGIKLPNCEYPSPMRMAGLSET